MNRCTCTGLLPKTTPAWAIEIRGSATIRGCPSSGSTDESPRSSWSRSPCAQASHAVGRDCCTTKRRTTKHVARRTALEACWRAGRGAQPQRTRGTQPPRPDQDPARPAPRRAAGSPRPSAPPTLRHRAPSPGARYPWTHAATSTRSGPPSPPKRSSPCARTPRPETTGRLSAQIRQPQHANPQVTALRPREPRLGDKSQVRHTPLDEPAPRADCGCGRASPGLPTPQIGNPNRRRPFQPWRTILRRPLCRRLSCAHARSCNERTSRTAGLTAGGMAARALSVRGDPAPGGQPALPTRSSAMSTIMSSWPPTSCRRPTSSRMVRASMP